MIKAETSASKSASPYSYAKRTTDVAGRRQCLRLLGHLASQCGYSAQQKNMRHYLLNCTRKHNRSDRLSFFVEPWAGRAGLCLRRLLFQQIDLTPAKRNFQSREPSGLAQRMRRRREAFCKRGLGRGLPVAASCELQGCRLLRIVSLR